MKKSCSNCVFGNKCRREEPCSFYCPIGDDAEDADVEEMDKEMRYAFQKEWNMYREYGGF